MAKPRQPLPEYPRLQTILAERTWVPGHAASDIGEEKESWITRGKPVTQLTVTTHNKKGDLSPVYALDIRDINHLHTLIKAFKSGNVIKIIHLGRILPSDELGKGSFMIHLNPPALRKIVQRYGLNTQLP